MKVFFDIFISYLLFTNYRELGAAKISHKLDVKSAATDI